MYGREIEDIVLSISFVLLSSFVLLLLSASISIVSREFEEVRVVS